MTSITTRKNIQETYSNIRNLSFEEKKDAFMDEDQVNAFLDAINDFKKKLITQTQKIYTVNSALEKLTWYNDLDDECLMLLNDLVASSKDLRSSLLRQYHNMTFLRKKGIAKSEIKDFKNAIDELRESYDDIESVFFFLPEIPEFKEVNRKLSLL